MSDRRRPFGQTPIHTQTVQAKMLKLYRELRADGASRRLATQLVSFHFSDTRKDYRKAIFSELASAGLHRASADKIPNKALKAGAKLCAKFSLQMVREYRRKAEGGTWSY